MSMTTNTAMKTVFIGADHAGFFLKDILKNYLLNKGVSVVDVSNATQDNQDDYVDFALAVSEKVASTPESVGILVCDSGTGMSIAANKVKGVFAANVWSEETAILSRQHNHTNVVCLGAKFITDTEAEKIVDAWLGASVSEEPRHLRRFHKMEDYDNTRV